MITLFHAADRKSSTRFAGLLRWASYLLIAGGIAALGYAASIYAVGRTYQAVELQRFRHPAPIVEPHVPIMGETIGEIRIASVGLQAVILEGASSKVLNMGVGHLPDTPLPGNAGNVVLAAHRDTFFRPLRRLHTGDIITVHSGTRTSTYQVDSITVVSPQEVGVLLPTERNELTLVTCFPFDYIGSAPRRFIVHASEVNQQTALPDT